MFNTLFSLLLITQLDSVAFKGEIYKRTFVYPESTKTDYKREELSIRVDKRGDYFWEQYFLPVSYMKQGRFRFFYSSKSTGFVKISEDRKFVEVRQDKLNVEIRFGVLTYYPKDFFDNKTQ